jgi:hypothetical protein
MNNRGFAALSLLLLAPVVVGALAVVSSGYLLLKADGQARHICRTELLDSQAKISVDLRDLMAMNKVAASLRIEREVAEAEVASTVLLPPAHAAAQAHETSVIVRQLALAANQKRLLVHAKLESQMAPAKTTRELHQTLTGLSLTHSDDNLSLKFSEKMQTAEFDVIASPRGNPTPDYNPSPNFERKQAMKISWSFNASALLPAWIRPLVVSAGIRAHGECAATLKKGDQQWQPMLNADKS